MKQLLINVVAFSLSVVAATNSRADDIPTAYADQANRSGVPASVLYAVALTESGRAVKKIGHRPWPWVLNIDGKAAWFESRGDAVTALERHLDSGVKNIDVGLMQVNWRFHATRFSSASEALDPFVNLAVGATILKEAWQDTGDWWKAVGQYHSRTADVATRYQARYARHLTQVVAASEETN